MAEFAANNNTSISIKLFLFFDTKSLHSYISFKIVEFSNSNTCNQNFK